MLEIGMFCMIVSVQALSMLLHVCIRLFLCIHFPKRTLSYSLGATLHLNTNAEQILITCSDFTRQEELGIEDGWMDFFGLFAL